MEATEADEDEDAQGGVDQSDSAAVDHSSALYFFDAAMVPGCPPPKLTAAVLPTGSEPEAATQRTLSPKGATLDAKGNALTATMQSVSSIPSSAAGLTIKNRATAGGVGSKRVVELTEENLKLIGKAGVDQQQEVSSAAQHVPDGWQAIVKRGYRGSRIDKNVRQTRLMKRLDQIRREM